MQAQAGGGPARRNELVRLSRSVAEVEALRPGVEAAGELCRSSAVLRMHVSARSASLLSLSYFIIFFSTYKNVVAIAKADSSINEERSWNGAAPWEEFNLEQGAGADVGGGADAAKPREILKSFDTELSARLRHQVHVTPLHCVF